MSVSDEELAAFFAAFRERAKGYGRPGPRPTYDPGAPSLPKPTTDAVPPQSHHDVDQDEEGD